jgi:hypothetical protein
VFESSSFRFQALIALGPHNMFSVSSNVGACMDRSCFEVSVSFPTRIIAVVRATLTQWQMLYHQEEHAPLVP